MFPAGKVIAYVKYNGDDWFQNHTRNTYYWNCSYSPQFMSSVKLRKMEHKRHFAVIQPPLKCFAMVLPCSSMHVSCDSNTAACCPDLLPACTSPHLRHLCIARPWFVWLWIACTLSTTQTVLTLFLCFSHYGLTIFLTQFLLWSFPAQPLSTHCNLILTTTVSQSNPTLWCLHEGLDTNAEHMGDIRALSPIASVGYSVPNCLGGLIREASGGTKDF